MGKKSANRQVADEVIRFLDAHMLDPVTPGCSLQHFRSKEQPGSAVTQAFPKYAAVDSNALTSTPTSPAAANATATSFSR